MMVKMRSEYRINHVLKREILNLTHRTDQYSEKHTRTHNPSHTLVLGHERKLCEGRVRAEGRTIVKCMIMKRGH